MNQKRSLANNNPDTALSLCFDYHVDSRDRVILAISGGADSTAMLHAAAVYFSSTKDRLVCVHIDHGMRTEEEALKEEAFVRDLTVRYSIPLEVYKIPRGEIERRAKESGAGLEAEAREARHRILNSVWRSLSEELMDSGLKGRVWIALAHNKNDLYEGILMRVLRGAGPHGLAPLPEENFPIIRPLLPCERSNIETWLKENDKPWCDDPSNSLLIYERNRIRHLLIPLLDRDFPFWKGGLSSFAETQGAVRDDIEDFLKTGPQWEERGAALELSLEDFKALSFYRREEVLYYGIDILTEKNKKKENLDPDRLTSASIRPPRRAVIRAFATYLDGAVDLPTCRLLVFSDKIRLEWPEKEISFISKEIKKAGIYNLGPWTVQISAVKEKGELSFPSSCIYIDLPCVISTGKSSFLGLKGRGIAHNSLDLSDCSGREVSFMRLSSDQSLNRTVHGLKESVHSKGSYYIELI